MKKVTIMIPTYNQAKYISKAIESALNINYPNIEVIVSDDCSSDNTEEVVSKYLSDDRFKYIKNEKNLGRVGNYRKTLYEYSSGDYVLNLDGDDWLVDSTFIEDGVKILDKNIEVSCIFGDRQNYNEERNTYKTFTNKDNTFIRTIMDGNNFFINMPNIGFIFSHISCLYRRDLALKLNFYSKDILSSDSESICKLYINHSVAYLPIIVGVWREHQENASHLKLKAKLENISKYDFLYDFALKSKVFDIKELNLWKKKLKTSTLSQDIIYYVRQKRIKDFISFLFLSLRFNSNLTFLSLINIFKRLLNEK